MERHISQRYIYHISFEITSKNHEEKTILEEQIEKKIKDLSKMNYSKLLSNTYVIVSETQLDFDSNTSLNLVINPNIKSLVSMVAEKEGKFQISNRTN